MDYLPKDPAILVSSANMLLNEDVDKLKASLLKAGYVYSEEQHQFRPIGFDK